MVTFSMTLMDLEPGFQGNDIFEVEYLSDKVTIEDIGNHTNLSNVTTFNDLY